MPTNHHTKTQAKTTDKETEPPLTYHIIMPRELREKGQARALCGQIIKRDDSLRLGKPKGRARYVVCPLCDLARMEFIDRLEQLVQPDNE